MGKSKIALFKSTYYSWWNVLTNYYFIFPLSDEQAKLVSILASSYGEFFIGLKYNDATYMFEWASGDVVTYTDAWDHYQPGIQ